MPWLQVLHHGAPAEIDHAVFSSGAGSQAIGAPSTVFVKEIARRAWSTASPAAAGIER
eukprot:m.89541 g.89541  ORF g.89541 m.89541 type:complete len:58 (-) comp8417_c0_seq1:852-1025(-)